jgi:diguanylate cyclase (GGDEF)-like protein
VLFLDLDRFKMLNDSLGHSAGDRLLIAAATRITGAVRSRDVVGRLGGDEFAVLCEDLVDDAQAVRIAERIVNELAAPLEIGALEVSPSASIGIAHSGGAACTAEELIGHADLAMYRAKRSDASYVVFDQVMRAEELRTLELEVALRRAVKHDELRLVYQPIVSLEDGETVGVEALLRWQHPTRGLLPPSEFICVAERTGAIVAMGEWVLRTACLEAARWPENSRGEKPYVSVNLSPRQFSRPNLVGTVASVLHDAGLPPQRLALEVTESLLLEDFDRPAETLRGLERLGVTIVLDDFGTGYSSLSYLNRFPISQLKLDRSFVARLGEGGPEEAVTTAIAGMAKALSMTLVAEGVESEAHVRALRLLGLRLAQGYHFARPQPIETLVAELEAQARTPARATG